MLVNTVRFRESPSTAKNSPAPKSPALGLRPCSRQKDAQEAAECGNVPSPLSEGHRLVPREQNEQRVRVEGGDKQQVARTWALRDRQGCGRGRAGGQHARRLHVKELR